MRIVRLGMVLALAATWSVVGWSAPQAAAAAAAQAGTAATCNEASWVAGIVELCGGELVYRDYVYDDYGADDPAVPQSSQSRTGVLSSSAGDARYATDVNSADLVELRLRVAGNRLHATFELNSLYRPDSTIAALAIDTDDNRSTGGGVWGDLGVSSSGWEVLATFTTGDPTTNMITGSLPLPSGTRWRIQAVTAKASPKQVMNVAFRGTDERTVTGAFWDDKQAAALASGTISEFGATVDVADLRGTETRPAPLPSGFHQRVYTSAYTLPPGEGMTYGNAGAPGRHGNTGNVCEQGFHFFGKYQPYGIYIPDKPGPLGLQLALHGCAANHSSLVDQPGMQANVGNALGRIIVTPLGRGPVGYYSDISERDVLDVLADVERTYAVDPERVFSGGYSMGGYGAFRLAMLYPHRFAGFISWVGFTGDCANNPIGDAPFSCPTGAVGNVIDFVRNLRHVPGAMLYGGADELVQVWSSTAMGQAFKAEQVPYTWYMHPAADHFLLALADDWRKEAASTRDLKRVTRPPRVVYRTDLSLAYPTYGIRHDRAYWVSGINAPRAGYSDVDVTTFACGGSTPTFTTGSNAGIDPVPWVSESRSVSGSTPLAKADRIEAALVNVSTLTIDVDDTCLAGKAIAYKVTTDGPAVVSFDDGRVLRLPAAGVHEGTVPAPTSRAAVTTTAQSGQSADEAPVELPATGGGVGASAGTLLLALSAALRLSSSRRRAADAVPRRPWPRRRRPG